MAAPNEPPRRVSMAYVLGFSNKPFKDLKPRQSSGLGEILSTTGGVVEWVASDGRKGKLSGHGQSRAHGERSKKASSEKGEDASKSLKDKGDKKEKANDENPHGFTEEEDEKMLEWKAANSNKPWTTFAEDIGKSVFQCKERFRQIKPKDSNQNTGNDKGKGGGGDQQPDQQKLTNKQKKALAKEKKDANQNQGQHQKNKKKEQNSSGEPTNTWDTPAAGGNDNSGCADNDTWGGMGGLFEDPPVDDDDKKSKKSNSSNKGNDNGDAPAWDLTGGWPAEGGTSGENNAASWDTTNNNTGGSKKDGTRNKGENGWNSGATGGWNIDNNGGGSNKGGDAWAGFANTSGANNGWAGAENSGGWGFNADATTGWDMGGGGTGDAKNTWDNSSQKPASNNGDAADAWATGVDGANDTTGGWAVSNDQTNANGANNTGWANTGAPAAKSASKAASHKSAHHPHKSTHGQDRTNIPLEIEVKPDSTFSADDLRLVARILQQDYQMVWNRVSWRFHDKTGRTVAPEVFEKKITGRIEGEKERKKKK